MGLRVSLHQAPRLAAVPEEEFKFRCERRLGEMLMEAAPHGGDRRSDQVDTPVNLKQLEIDERESARSRKLALIPEEEFEAKLAEAREAALNCRHPTTVTQEGTWREKTATIAFKRTIGHGYEGSPAPGQAGVLATA